MGPTASHAYRAPGVYTVALTVTDATGASTAATQQVTVFDEPPSAAFVAGPAVPVPGQPVAFDAGDSTDPDGSIVSYAWDFGDGATGTGPTPSHAYASAGPYTVRLTVGDSAGRSAAVSEPVTVYAPPQSTFSYAPALPAEHVATTFAAAPAGGSAISSYAWNFGDGASTTGATVAHAYASRGSYRVTLTVTDVFGLIATTTELVTVIDAPPTPVIAVLTSHALRGHGITFSGARSHDDDDPIVSYLWHFGDGAGGVGR